MLSFGDAVGNLFNRLGKLAALIENAAASQATQRTALTDATSGATAQFDGEPDLQAILGAGYVNALNAIGAAVGPLAQQVARATVDRMVFRDSPRPGQTLTQQAVADSIAEIIRQMKLAGATVLAQTVTATPAAFTGGGNGVCVASVRRPLDGLVLEHAFAEDILLTVTADSYTGSRRAGNESLRADGEGAQNNVFAFDWPLGSGGRLTFSAVDAGTDNGAGNLLTNGDFEDWTSNVPDQWEITTGTAGTHVFDENSIVFDGESALRLTGDGTTAVALRQAFDDSAGTRGKLKSLTQYAVNGWLRRDGTAAAAGTLIVELVDAEGDVIQDEAGNANTFTINLTALSTVYTAYNGVFRTPDVLPDEIYLRLRIGTALTSGRSVYLDRLGMAPMGQLYTGGPYLIVFSGSTPFVAGDFTTVAVTNSRGAAGTLNTWQTALFRLLDPLVSQNEFLFPSSSSPTISDNLIG